MIFPFKLILRNECLKFSKHYFHNLTNMDIKEKLVIKNKIKDKMEGERPLSLSFYSEDWKKSAELKAKDDWSMVLFIDWDEEWTIWEESFLFFVQAYVNKCVDEYDEDDEEKEEEDEKVNDKLDEVESKKKELATMMLNKATRE